LYDGTPGPGPALLGHTARRPPQPPNPNRGPSAELVGDHAKLGRGWPWGRATTKNPRVAVRFRLTPQKTNSKTAGGLLGANEKWGGGERSWNSDPSLGGGGHCFVHPTSPPWGPHPTPGVGTLSTGGPQVGGAGGGPWTGPTPQTGAKTHLKTTNPGLRRGAEPHHSESNGALCSGPPQSGGP